MNIIQTQTLSIKGNGGGEAYIDFCDGQLCVSVVIEGVPLECWQGRFSRHSQNPEKKPNYS